MHFRTIKSIVDNETDEVIPFAVLGVVIAECCFDAFMEQVDEDVMEEFNKKYCFVSTNLVLGHPDGFVIIGKFVFDVDTNKTIEASKSEIMDDFLKYKLITDNVTMVSEGVVFIGGVQINDADEEIVIKEPTEEEKEKQSKLEDAIRKERSEK
jgi:hypothetical protein